MRRKNYIPNDNQDVIRLLSDNFARSAKGRNRILFLTAVLSIITITMVFGLSWGKIRSETLHTIRAAGTAASGVVENGNVSQYVSLKAQSYIKRSGRSITAGTAEVNTEAESGTKAVCTVKWADDDAWNYLLCPAYTEIQGSYPEEEQEIMLSRRALENIGILTPHEGMEIPLKVTVGLFRESEETFILCGWFTDYSYEAAPGYVSRKKMNVWGFSVNEEADLFFCQQNWFGWQETERRLYKDLEMRNQGQKITVADTAGHLAMTGAVGGYAMAVLGTVIVLCGIFFLSHNVMQISMAGDIRKLGLLNTIGATRRQLTEIYYRQIRRILVLGTAAGTMISVIMLIIIFPQISKNQYPGEAGDMELLVVTLAALLLSIFFTDGILLATSVGVIRRTTKMSCVESINYRDVSCMERRHRKRRKLSLKKRSAAWEISYLAWRNIAGHRKRFILTVLSLFLGLETFLAAVVITAGNDYSHVIEQRPDFLIAGQFSAFGREQGYGEEYRERDAGQDPMLTEGDNLILLYDNHYDEFSPISKETREKLLGIDGVNKDQSYVMEGAYLYAVISSKGIRSMEETSPEDSENAEMIEGAVPAVVQILEEDEIEVLKDYAEANGLPVDMDALHDGTGALLLHDHALSAGQENLAEESVGEPLYFHTMRSKKSGLPFRRSEDFALCGYLDNRSEGFPKIRQTWHGAEGSWYFLISEAGFEKIPTEKKTLYMELEVDQDRETLIKSEVQKIVSEENLYRSRMAEGTPDKQNGEAGIFYISKSDMLQDATAYIQRNRMILGSISAVLLLAGLTNYFNVVITGAFARRKELKIMESVGMTEKQKKGMLLMEGGYYYLFTVGLLLTAGTGILILIRYYMEQKVSYFSFTWPVTWLFLLAGVFAAINIAAVRIMCKE